MKKFTLLCCSLCAVFSAAAQDFTRLTADELNAATTSKRIAIRCTQESSYLYYYTGANSMEALPLNESMIYDWEPVGDGSFYIKKTFAESSAYLQTDNIITFGEKDSDTVAKFTAVKPYNGGSGVESFGGANCFEDAATGGDYYVRLSFSDKSKWFNFNGYVYNTGTGVWTVQNILDLSEYYKVTINITKDGEITTETSVLKVGEIIEVPEYDGYTSDYVATEKTADDNQVIDVTYTSQGLPYELVTNETVSTAIVDGAVIALQCKDTNGGLNYYFNGGEVKSASIQGSNFFKVVGVEGSETGEFYLQQCSTGMYVGGDAATSGALVAMTEDVASAVAFTAAIATPTGWTTKPDDVVAGTNTVRFTATTGGMFLNTNNTGAVPKYFDGTGGFSAWYVYTYTAEGVLEVIMPDEATYSAMFKDDTPGFYSTTGVMYEAVMAAYNDVKAMLDGNENVTVDEAFAAVAAIDTVMAETEDNSALDVVFGGVYTIANQEGTGSRGYLCDVQHADDYVWSSGKTSTEYTAPALTDAAAQWAFVEIRGERLMFNVGTKRFISPTDPDATVASNPWVLSAGQAEPITLAFSKDGVGTVEIQSVLQNEALEYDTYYMSISNGHDTPVAGYYTATDGGVPFVFTRVGDLSDELKTEMAEKSPITTDIQEIGTTEGSSAEFFDINGRRVVKPVSGLYIKRQGNKVRKVIL